MYAMVVKTSFGGECHVRSRCGADVGHCLKYEGRTAAWGPAAWGRLTFDFVKRHGYFRGKELCRIHYYILVHPCKRIVQ